jgi:hypothetical protein
VFRPGLGLWLISLTRKRWRVQPTLFPGLTAPRSWTDRWLTLRLEGCEKVAMAASTMTRTAYGRPESFSRRPSQLRMNPSEAWVFLRLTIRMLTIGPAPDPRQSFWGEGAASPGSCPSTRCLDQVMKSPLTLATWRWRPHLSFSSRPKREPLFRDRSDGVGLSPSKRSVGPVLSFCEGNLVLVSTAVGCCPPSKLPHLRFRPKADRSSGNGCQGG